MTMRLKNLLKVSALSLVLIMGSGCGTKDEPVPQKPGGLQPGDPAYNFSLVDSHGQVIKLSDMKPGWCLVMILYRGHWCSACQGQLTSLKEDYDKFLKLHASIVAVSVDPVEDSADFNGQWRFPFPLLSDTQFKVIDAYGARHPNGHEGKDISRPAVILIDPNKIVRFKYIGKDPTDRPTNNEILYDIQDLQRQEGIKLD